MIRMCSQCASALQQSGLRSLRQSSRAFAHTNTRLRATQAAIQTDSAPKRKLEANQKVAEIDLYNDTVKAIYDYVATNDLEELENTDSQPFTRPKRATHLPLVLLRAVPPTMSSDLVGTPQLYDSVMSAMKQQQLFKDMSLADFNKLLIWIPTEFRRHYIDDILMCMEAAKILPDLSIIHKFMAAYSSLGMIQETKFWFTSLKERNIAPSEATYALLLKAYQFSSHYLTDSEKAIEEMRTSGLVPSCTHYSILMGGYARAGHYDTAWKTWSLMKYRGDLAPDKLAYYQAMKICAWQKDVHRATDLYMEMMENNLAPEPMHYTALTQACASNSEYYEEAWKHAKKALEKANYAVTFNVILGACGKRGDLAAARSIFQIIGQTGIPDRTSFMALLRCYSTYRPKGYTGGSSPRNWRRYVRRLYGNQQSTPLERNIQPSQIFTNVLDLPDVWREFYRVLSYMHTQYPQYLDTQMVNAAYSVIAQMPNVNLSQVICTLFQSSDDNHGPIEDNGVAFNGPPFTSALLAPKSYSPVKPNQYTFDVIMQSAYDLRDGIVAGKSWENYQIFREMSPEQIKEDVHAQIWLRYLHLLAILERFEAVEHELETSLITLTLRFDDLAPVWMKAGESGRLETKQLVENIWHRNGDLKRKKKAPWAVEAFASRTRFQKLQDVLSRTRPTSPMA